MPSIIIPAYNEEAVIGRTLESVLSSIGDLEVEVIVVCNACQDRTAEFARSIDERVRVIETETPGKCNAINLGESYAQTFPRIYLDADITVSRTFVPDMVVALSDKQPRVAWPNVEYDLSESSWAVRAFYKVWTTLPYNQPGRIGVGVYALSEGGRASFGDFPEIISDDGFIRGLLDAAQRTVVESCHTTVRAPKDWSSLIAVRTRSRMGVMELGQKHPEAMQKHSVKRELPWASYLACLRPSVLLAMPVYLAGVLITKRQAKQRLAAKVDALRWDRDLSQRPA